MLDVVPLRYGTAFKKAFSDPLAFHALVEAAVGIDFTPDHIEQEYSYRQPVSRVNVAYDLFAEDAARRTIVELQHIREDTTYDRFLYYHAIGLVEQIVSNERYKFERDVYTLVLFTRWPDDPALRYGRAVCDLDPVTDEGARLNVYRHRLVFVHARAPMEKLPPSLRPLMGLIDDTLDGHVDETRYPDVVSQHILARIQREGLTPEENARLKDEASWEDAKREERHWGRVEGESKGELKAKRDAVLRLLMRAGIILTDDERARILACTDPATLDRWFDNALGAKSGADVLT